MTALASRTSPRVRTALLFAAGVLLVAITLSSLRLIGIAHADAAPSHAVATIAAQVTVPSADPVAIATSSTDAGVGLLVTYGPLWGGMLLLFGIASSLLTRYQSSSWLAQGRRLAISVALLGASAAALQAHFAGSPWGGVLLTLVVGVFKVLVPTVTPPTPTPAPSSPATTTIGSAAALLLVLGLAGAGGIALTGCTGAQIKADVAALLDCTSSERAELVAAATPLADSAIAKATNPDGSLDTAALKALFAAANLKTEAGSVLACLAVETLGSRAAAPTVTARVAAGDVAAPIGVSAQAALEQLRAAQFPGVKFRTPAGVQ